MPKRVDSTMLIFADDIKIYGRADLPGDEVKLREDMNAMVERSEQWQLPFHPDKAKMKHVEKSRAQCILYTLGNEPEALLTVTEEKDLGMAFDSSLKFEVHIAGKVKKANRTLGIIRRTFRFLDDFCSLVRPHLEHASSLWSPRLVKLTTMVENVQKRATRLLKNSENQSYEDRMRRLDLPTLSFRKLRGDMIEAFKIMHPTAGYDCRASLSLLQTSQNKSTRGHFAKLRIEKFHLNRRKFAFSQRIVNDWNSLPELVMAAKTVNSVKSRLDAHWSTNRNTHHHRRKDKRVRTPSTSRLRSLMVREINPLLRRPYGLAERGGAQSWHRTINN